VRTRLRIPRSLSFSDRVARAASAVIRNV
jgi:hypothetical protein